MHAVRRIAVAVPLLLVTIASAEEPKQPEAKQASGAIIDPKPATPHICGSTAVWTSAAATAASIAPGEYATVGASIAAPGGNLDTFASPDTRFGSVSSQVGTSVSMSCACTP